MGKIKTKKEVMKLTEEDLRRIREALAENVLSKDNLQAQIAYAEKQVELDIPMRSIVNQLKQMKKQLEMVLKNEKAYTLQLRNKKITRVVPVM